MTISGLYNTAENVKSASGSVISLNDSSDKNIKSFIMYGKSTQNGTPTPENPQEIESVENPEVIALGKNLLQFPYATSENTRTSYGVTFTVNEDGSVFAKGTAVDGNAVYSLMNLSIVNDFYNKYKGKTVTLSGGLTATKHIQFWNNSTGSNGTNDSGAGVTFTIPDIANEFTSANLSIVINKGTTANDIFYPMIRLASDSDATWEPYKAKQNKQINKSLYAIPVESGGNYTDESGQQWITDTLAVNADGSGKIVRRLKKKVVDKTYGGGVSSATNPNGTILYLARFSDLKPNTTNILCTKLRHNKDSMTNMQLYDMRLSGSTMQAVYFVSPYNDYAECRNAMFGDDFYFIYELQNPTEETLTPEEVNAILSLHTYKPNTVIYNDCGAGMEVEYVSDYKQMIIPKTDWKESDRFNIIDFNRIKNNLNYLIDRASEYYKPFESEDMGEDMNSYSQYWDVDKFNAFEENLDSINENMFTQDYGYGKMFFENGQFIKYDELNRIESATLNMYDILERQKAGFRSLSFSLGQHRQIKV